MTIKEIKISELKEYENNPRINDNAVDKVAASIQNFGLKCRIAIINNRYLITEKGDIYRLYKKGKLKIELQAKRKHSNGYLRGVIDGKDVYIEDLMNEIKNSKESLLRESEISTNSIINIIKAEVSKELEKARKGTNGSN